MRKWRRFACLIAGASVLAGAGCRTLPERRAPSKHSSSSAVAGALGDSPALDGSVMRASASMKPGPNSNILFHLDLARGLDAQGQIEAANSAYQRAAQAARSEGVQGGSPAERADLHRRIARALERTGAADEARQHYKNAQKLAPKDTRVWNDSGYSAYLRGDWKEAERCLRKALAVDPSNQCASTNLGLVLAASGRGEDALKEWQRTQDSGAAHANLGFVKAAQGDNEAARAHYERALAANPTLQQPRKALERLQAGDAPASSLAVVEDAPLDPKTTKTSRRR